MSKALDEQVWQELKEAVHAQSVKRALTFRFSEEPDVRRREIEMIVDEVAEEVILQSKVLLNRKEQDSLISQVRDLMSSAS